MESLVTCGAEQEKSVRSERQHEEKENDQVEMKTSYATLVKVIQSAADVEMERMRDKLKDFEAAFEEEDREIVSLNLMFSFDRYRFFLRSTLSCHPLPRKISLSFTFYSLISSTAS